MSKKSKDLSTQLSQDSASASGKVILSARRANTLRTKVLAALDSVGVSEEQFLSTIINAVSEDAKAGNLTAAVNILGKLYPAPKAVLDPVNVGFEMGDTVIDKARKVSDAVVSGAISADHGAQIMNVLSSQVGIEAAYDMEARLANLERLANLPTIG